MAVSLYVVILRSVGADGGPDGWGDKWQQRYVVSRLTLYAQICCAVESSSI